MGIEVDKKFILAFTLGVVVTAIFVSLLQPNDLSKEEAADIVVAKVYSEFGADEYFVEVLSTQTVGENMYKVEVALKKVTSAENISFFITKDGKKIIRESEEAEAEETEQNTTGVEEDTPPPTPSSTLNAKGPEDAKVTIIEYSDYQCSFCKKFRDDTLDAILEAYPDDVRFIFKNFPLESIHPAAYSAAEAAECAGEQGKYWEYHDKLFADSEWQQQRRAAYLRYAEELGLDVEAFTQCIDTGKYRSKIRTDLNEGVQLGVRGTPAFIINGKLISGAQPFSAFQQEIDAILSGAPTTPPPTTAPPQRVEVSVGDSAYLGPEDASVTIIEFSEFACSYCKRFHDNTLPLILENYGDKVKFVFRHYIVHESARKAAEASECAHEQDKFFEYHDMLFARFVSDVASLKQYAADLELDTAQFDGCLDSEKYAAKVQKDMQDGRSAGVSGTPAFFVNDRFISGAQPFSVFEQAIEAELAKQ